MTDNKSSIHLVKAMGLGFVIIVTIANILGSGVYKKVAPMANELGSPGWVLVAWLAGGIITLFGALSMAEIAGLMAETGGEYAYYKKIYNPFVAFLFGWSLFIVVQTASIASLSYVVSQSLQALVPFPPLLSGWEGVTLGGVIYPFADFTTKILAVIVILALTFFNTRGVVAGVRLTNIILWTICIGIGVIIIFGLTSSASNIPQAFSFETVNNKQVTISAMFTAMLAAFWAYQGWTTVGFMGGEVKDANRNVPRGIVYGTLAVIGIYLLVNITYLSVLSIPQLQAVHNSGNQIAAVEVIRSIWGGSGVVFISALILITTIGCTHATIYGSARPDYAMAKEGLFFKSSAKLNRFHAPGNALWLQGIWSCVLVFSGSFDQLTDMLIFAIFIFYGLTTVAVFILRVRMPDAHRPYKVWGYPFIPAIFILVCIGLLINTVVTQPREAIIGLALVATGIPMYFYFRKQKTA